MNSIIKLALVAALAIFAQNVNAQETKEEKREREQKELIDKTKIEIEKSKINQIATLKSRREEIREDGKRTLKIRIETINAWKDKWELTPEEVEERKKKAAEEIAANIENQLAIIDNQIALVERTGRIDPSQGTSLLVGLGNQDEDGNRILGIAYNTNKTRVTTYDNRTYGEMVIATGLNNVVSDNAEIGDDFSIGRSNFFELGYAWKTRVFENSGSLQFKYGLSLQSNKVFKKNNEIAVVTNGVTAFEVFPFNLKKSQIRTTNLVVPLHLEFGGLEKIQEDNYVRYRTGGKFRMGIGGYAGVRLGTQQKLKYKENGERIKTKSRQDLGGDNLVYGISSYIRVTGDLSIYGKYDLSSAFKAQGLGEVNNVSLGLRLDL